MVTLKEFLLLLAALQVFALVYGFLLKPLKAPIFKRFYLIFSPIVAVFLPFFNFSWFRVQQPFAEIPTLILDPVSVVATQEFASFNGTLLLVYIAVAMFVLARFAIGVVQLFKLKKASEKCHLYSETVWQHSSIKSPFTFFSWIFLPKKNVHPLVVFHEAQHKKLWHSLDTVLVFLYQALLWWSPATWFYKSWINENHEHEVDDLLQPEKHSEYQRILLEEAIPNWEMFLSHPFSLKKQLKTRIIMMKSKKQEGKTILGMGVSVVVAVVVIASLQVACTEKAIPEIKQLQTNEVEKSSAKEIYAVVDEMPQFADGDKAFFEFIQNNLEFPKSLEKDNKEGVSFVTFVITEDGAVTQAKVAKGFAPEADAAALEVVNSMPNWIPGKQAGVAVPVKMTIPIRFQLK